MTCKDCLHSEVCHVVKITCGFKENAETLCKSFKNEVDYAEVKHGEWIPCGDGEHTPLMCSSCFNTWSFYKQRGSKCCPNCGAKMDKKEGAEE